MARRSGDSGLTSLRRRILTGSCSCFALLASAASGFAQTATTWTDGNGSWFTPGNWSGGLPNGGIDATVENGGTPQVDGGRLAGANTLTIAAGSGVEISSGSHLALVNSNGSGTISIEGGFLEAIATANTQTFTNPIAVTTKGGVINSVGASLTLSGAISGSGSTLIISNSEENGAPITLSGQNTFSGILSLSSAAVVAGRTNAFGSGTLQIDSQSVADMASYDQTISSLTGSGLLVNTNANGSLGSTQTNVFTVQSGDFSGSIFDSRAQKTDGNRNTVYNYGKIALVKTGSGTLTLSGQFSNYSGGTQIKSGTIAVGSESALGTGPVALSGSGRLQADVGSGSLTLGNAITIGSGGGTIDSNGAKSIELTGNITEAVAGGGQLTLVNSIGTPTRGGLFDIILSGTNSNTGGALITGNTIVQSNAADALGTGAFQLDSGGNFFLGQYGQSVTSLTGSGAIAATGYLASSGSAQATLTVESGSFSGTLRNGSSYSQSGDFTGTLALAKTSTGTLTLVGDDNNFAGGTRLQAGTLALSGNHPLGTGLVAMSDGTTIRTVAGTALPNDFTLAGTDTFDMSGTGSATAPYSGGMKITGDISGNGKLVKTGDLGLQLDGDNSYSGGTLVEAGHVGVGNDNAFGTGPVTFDGGFLAVHTTGHTVSNATTLDQTTTFDLLTYTLTYAGAISGAGGLKVTDGGTLYLTAVDTYGGGTTVDGATLILGNGSHSGSITGDVTVTNGTFGFNEPTSGTPYTFAGAISGNGRVYQYGPGTVILSGDNTYTGPTNIQNGTLQLGSATALGSGSQVYIPTGGTLALAGFSPTIGGLYDYGNGKSDGGTVLLQGGTLTVGAGDVTSAFSGTIADGTVSGGKLVKTGTGTLALNGTNTFSGGITIESGKVSIDGGAALGRGTLTFDRGTALVVTANANIANNWDFAQPGDPTIDTGANFVTMSGTISGPGNLEKLGTGTLDLTGTNTYTGTTTVEQGALVVDGSIVSPTTVDSGAALGGAGTVAGFHVLAGGALAPGAATPFVTLTATGNATFDAGSFYRVTINAAGQTDKVAIDGTATLDGGTVVVSAVNGNYSAANRYTILTATGGRTGQFSSATLSSNLAFLTPVLSYDAKDVYLGFTQTAAIGSAGSTPNQQAVAGAVQSLGPSNPVYQALLGQTPAGVQQALQSLSGQPHASTPGVAVNSTHFGTHAVFDRFWNIPVDGGGDAVSVLDQFGSTTTPAALRCYTPQDVGPGGNLTPANYTVWGQAVGDFGHILGDGNAASVMSTLGGFALGIDSKVDAKLFDNWRVGISGGYTSDDFTVSGGGGHGTFENVFGTLYGGARYGAVDVRLGGSYGATTTTTARTVAFPGFLEAEHSIYGGEVAQGFGELGYRFALPQAVVEPVAGAGVTYAHEDSYRERGGAAALLGFAQDTTVETTTLGVRSEVTPFAEMPLVARLFLGWQHGYGDLNPATTQAFKSGSAAFSSYGTPLDRDAAVAETAVEYRASNDIKLSLAYSGQIGRHDRDNAVRGRAEYRF